MKTKTTSLIILLLSALCSITLFSNTLLLVDFDQTITEGDIACDGRKPCKLKPEAIEFLKKLILQTETRQNLNWYIWSNNFASIIQKTLQEHQIIIDDANIIDAEIPQGKLNWAASKIKRGAYKKVVIIDDDTKVVARLNDLGISKEFLEQNKIEFDNLIAQKRTDAQSSNEAEFWEKAYNISFPADNSLNITNQSSNEASCCCCYLQ